MIEATSKNGQLSTNVKMDAEVLGAWCSKDASANEVILQPRIVYVKSEIERENKQGYENISEASMKMNNQSFKELTISDNKPDKSNIGAKFDLNSSKPGDNDSNKFQKRVSQGLDVFKSLTEMGRVKK